MAVRTLNTDYLIVGCGAAGMAFADTLIAESDADVIMVDRRAAPGGHWLDAYPFVRLHQPSLYYGVNSMSLGEDALLSDGPEAGLYPRASGAEICAYYDRVMGARLIPSGRVRYFPQSDYLGGHRFASRLSGETFEVDVRRNVVDATYLSPGIPATTPPPFDVGHGTTVIPVNELGDLAGAPGRFIIVGAGKTAMDACVWLLLGGVDPTQIQWIKPRESWLMNRAYAQPGVHVGRLLMGLALQMEAAARASSADDLFDRLEAGEQFRRVDRGVRPTMYRGATIGDWEITLLRRIEDVVRLGHIRRVERGRIELDGGTVRAGPRDVFVHCAAEGLRRPPSRPIFGAGVITLQPVRTGLIPFNAALVAFVEAHREDPAEKNRLCPPNPLPSTALDWARSTLIQMRADRAWSQEDDIAAWLERSRLNPMRGLRTRTGDPVVEEASRRFAAHAGPGLARLAGLLPTGEPAAR
jgi:hypothetical protein